MKVHPLLNESANIRVEAAKVLQHTAIERVLHNFGQPKLIGSYAYNVMLMRDLDFHVIIKSFSLTSSRIFCLCG